MRCWGKRMGTAYVAAGRCSKQPYNKGQGWGGLAVKPLESSKAPPNPSPSYAWSPGWRRLGELSLTPDMLPYSKCHSALYRGSSPSPGELEPRGRLLLPRTGLLLEGQGKLAVNQQQEHLPTAAPCLPYPGAVSFQLPLLPLQSWCRMHRAGSRQDPQLARAAHNQPATCTWAALPPNPPSRWESFPEAGWSEPCPCTQRTWWRCCSRLPALLGGWHKDRAHFATTQQFFGGWSGLHSCFQFSKGEELKQSQNNTSSPSITTSPAPKIWRG